MTDPAQIAANDQERAEAVNQAGLTAEFFLTLVARGLERVEALELTAAWQSEMFGDGDEDG